MPAPIVQAQEEPDTIYMHHNVHVVRVSNKKSSFTYRLQYTHDFEHEVEHDTANYADNELHQHAQVHKYLFNNLLQLIQDSFSELPKKLTFYYTDENDKKIQVNDSLEFASALAWHMHHCHAHPLCLQIIEDEDAKMFQ